MAQVPTPKSVTKTARVASPKVAKPAPVQLGVPAATAVVHEPAPFIAPLAADIAAIAPVTPEPAPAPNDAAASTTEGTKTMTIETMTTHATTAAHDAATATTEKASAFFNDASTRAKDAMGKGTKAVEELVEFSKGNMEAMMTSGRVAAKGAEEIAKYTAEYARATIERGNATAKQFAAVKSPTEFFQLQGEVAKSALDAIVSEGSKFTESYLKLLGEVSQPIQNRVAVAVDKVKTTNAA